jgi:glutathione S-transferase
MTKLYYTSGSCAAASFIAAFIANVPIETEQVNLREHKTSSGVDFYSINPKGNVPTLVLDDGTILNEGAAILQYIADQVRFDCFHLAILFN